MNLSRRDSSFEEASLLLRHYLSSVIFIYEVINKIQNLKSIYVSGWDIYEGPNLNKTKKNTGLRPVESKYCLRKDDFSL